MNAKATMGRKESLRLRLDRLLWRCAFTTLRVTASSLALLGGLLLLASAAGAATRYVNVNNPTPASPVVQN